MAEEHKSSSTSVLFGIGVFLLVAMGGVMAIFWNKLPPQLPWLYSFPWGEKQLVSKMWLAGIILGMGFLLLITRLISRWAGKNDATVQTSVMAGGVMAVVLMAASFVRIMMIFLNT